MKNPFLLLQVILFACLSACTPTPTTPMADTRAEDEKTIRELDAQWSKTAGAHDLDGTVSYYTDDASLLPPNAPIALGKKAMREAWAPLVAPDSSVSWQVTKVEVSRSGDLGYVVGTYDLSMKGAGGKTETDKGKLVEVWKKQADGKWKVVADIFNSDLPPAPAAAAPAKK